VTSAAVLQEVENTQTAAKDAVLHGPHSAQCRGGRRLVDEWGLYIRAYQAVANNADAVKIAQNAIAKAEEFAAIEKGGIGSAE
jgi:hypothetical protein